MSDNTQLLQDILVTQILILSKLMDAEKRDGGTIRSGGDYTRDAIHDIKQKRDHVFQDYLSR